ncbi:YebC/PmpR family DNA-binding transcriptional regulator [Candidatus Peregrinibacteria bacterium]|nr:YebC/PmpR family DNA-binding transcriptional regulator [Candidatus Peregrinibacteria bacterium]
MAGHSKWHNIKHKKAAQDAKMGKIFTKHAKLIQIAASQGGGDPTMNPALRAAVENAKADNVPTANIERAIKKGTGEGKDASQISEVLYEAFGPSGTAFYIETLTDNKNRTITNVKIILNKKGGTFGAAGSVGYLFNKKGIIEIPISEQNEKEELELAAIDAGAEDVETTEEFMVVYTDPQDLMKVKDQLMRRSIQVKSAELSYMPVNYVEIKNAEDAQKVINLIESLEEDEDVSTVYTNANIDYDILKQLNN